MTVSEVWPSDSSRGIREDGSAFPVLHSVLCPCFRGQAEWEQCAEDCVAHKYRPDEGFSDETKDVL
jgi:hypothetical protein